MAKISNLQSLAPEDYPNAPDWFLDYMQSQNSFNRDVFNQVNGGLSSANLVDKYSTVDLDHGVATRVKVPGVANLVGVAPVRCIGVELGADGKPTRTLYYTLGMPRIDWYPAANADGIVIVTATYPSGSGRGRITLKFHGG